MSKLKTVRKGYNRARELSTSIPDFIPNKGNIFAVQGNLNSLNKLLTGPVVNADIGPSEANWDKFASLAYGANYGDKNYTLNDYKKSTNWLGISKEANPFSKANMSGGLKTMANTRLGAGLISGLTGVVGGLGKSLISDGLNSDVGNGIASFGSTVGGAIGLVNPLAGAAVSIGSNLVGGVFNRLFGMSVDQAKLKAANEGTAAYNNFRSNATNFSDISGPVAQANVQNAYRGGVFTSGEAAKLNQSLHKMRTDAKTFAERNVVNNVNNIANNQMNEALANYSADGGYINIGSNIDPTTAIGYALTLELIAGKDNKNNSNMTNLFAGMPSSMFAFGGNVQSNSADFSTGLSHVNAGDSHELNTYGGVLVGVDNQGVPNLVEEGEVIYDDYVFSNRLKVPNYKKEYKKKQEAPYEAQVLWKYSDNTFADVAKKIEKNTGSDERPEDNISQRGMEAELEVLKLVQEKEREKDKLQLMQEAIDNMTPEEFAMLLQQMQAGQELQAQQEAAMQQQLMIPQGMEQMVPQEQMMSAYGGPIYSLGGILNTPRNTYAYGGSLEDFTKAIARYGLSILDYINFLNQETNTTPSESPADEFTPENFNKDIAEQYLKRAETISKQYARRAKRQGVKLDNLTGGAKAQYNRELNQAIQKGMADEKYNIAADENLTFNDSRVSKAKNKQLEYSNVAAYNDLMAIGGRGVQRDVQGKPMWESIEGLKKIDNSAEGFYNDANNYTLENGIYDYTLSTPSSIANANNIRLKGWTLGEDNNYVISPEYNNPNEASLQAGNSTSTYKPSNLGDLTYGAEGYNEALLNILNNEAYKAQTEYVKKAITDAEGDYNKLPSDILNYLSYLDTNTGNKEAKLLSTDNKGNVTLNAKAADLYDRRRNDNIYGIYHYQFDKGNDASANRYYYKDEDGDLKIYIQRPQGNFTISETPTTVQTDNGTIFNDYEVQGLNKNRILTQLPSGDIVDVTDIDGIENWAKLPTPVLQDNTDNLGYGIKGTTNWVDYKGDNKTGNDAFPEASTWPYLAAGLALLGSLGYNLFSPIDYSNADAMINATLNASRPRLVSYNPIPYHIGYKPDDPWFYTSPITALANSTLRAISNKLSPSIGAETLLNSYNTMIALGKAAREASEHNFDKEYKVANYQTGVDEANSKGFLLADMANQDAASKASSLALEGLYKGYAMRQAIEDAKSKSINANIGGIASLLYNYGTTRDLNALLKYGYDKVYGTGAKGGSLRRKKKGLSF